MDLYAGQRVLILSRLKFSFRSTVYWRIHELVGRSVADIDAGVPVAFNPI